MKKEDLLKIDGLTDEQADKVLELYKGYIPKDRFDELNNAKKNAESLLTERDAQINELKKGENTISELKSQIKQLQADNNKVRLDSAIALALKDAKAKNIKAVLPFITANEFDENGGVKGLKEQIENLKKSDGYLFEIEQQTAPKGATPVVTNTDTKGTLTKEQFNKMSYKERVELFNNDKATYEQLTKEE